MEIKKKYDGIVYKRRVGCSLTAAYAYLTGRVPYENACVQNPLSDQLQQDEALTLHSIQIAREIDAFAARYRNLRPSMYIVCERTAYAPVPGADADGLRITFDSGVAYRDVLAGERGAGSTFHPLLGLGEAIMEVKTAGALPVCGWSRMLGGCQAYPSSFSKYGAAYQECERARRRPFRVRDASPVPRPPERMIVVLDSALSSVFGTADSLVASVSTVQFLMCCAASIVLGAAVACVYMFRHTYSKNFVVTLALLPLIVQMVITLVNGNLGAGIAVMGVFNLVRFRSHPRAARRISAACFWPWPSAWPRAWGSSRWPCCSRSSLAVVNVVYVLSPFGRAAASRRRSLRVTVPEDLEFDGMFDAVLARYTAEHELTEVRTTNMGSLYQLEYQVRLAQPGIEKRLMDEVRCLNGNLKVSLSNAQVSKEVL